jgi:hypothetical protein
VKEGIPNKARKVRKVAPKKMSLEESDKWVEEQIEIYHKKLEAFR